MSTQPSIPPRSVTEYQLWLGRQRQVWLIPLAYEMQDVRVKLLDYAYELWQLLSVLYSDVWKKNYIGAHPRPWTTAMEFSSNLSAVCTKWCAQTFLPIFGLLVIFDSNFATIVVPPSDKNVNYVMHLKGQPLLKKWWKPCWNWPINSDATPVSTMSPLERDRQSKKLS